MGTRRVGGDGGNVQARPMTTTITSNQVIHPEISKLARASHVNNFATRCCKRPHFFPRSPSVIIVTSTSFYSSRLESREHLRQSLRTPESQPKWIRLSPAMLPHPTNRPQLEARRAGPPTTTPPNTEPAMASLPRAVAAWRTNLGPCHRAGSDNTTPKTRTSSS